MHHHHIVCCQLALGLRHLDALLFWKDQLSLVNRSSSDMPWFRVGVAVPLAARSRITGLCLARLVARRLGLCGWYHAFCLELGALSGSC